MASPSLATSQVEELEGEIPQLPVIVPGTVQGSIASTSPLLSSDHRILTLKIILLLSKFLECAGLPKYIIGNHK